MNDTIRSKKFHTVVGAVLLLGLSLSCREASTPEPAAAAAGSSATADVADAEDTPEPAPEAEPLPPGLAVLLKPYKGDLDGLVERRLIRVLTVQDPILYFVDRGREVGIVYEALKLFEKELNQKLGNKNITVHVIMIPMSRDQLLPSLARGEGDIAAAGLTITPDRLKEVDFAPTAGNVREVVVTGADEPEITSPDQLSGQEVYVRESSSYAEHLRALNESFKARKMAPVTIVSAPEILNDGDILEMVNAGLTPRTVVDGYMADLYMKVFPNLRKGVPVAEGQEIGWAIRKDSPKLTAAIAQFVKKNGTGTLMGNVLLAKYLKTTKWVKNARSAQDRQRFTEMAKLFKKYSDKYEFDYLLMAAQGYQESGLDQSKRSHVGAIGVMQVMPATARDKAVGIPDIDKLESNIHAGIKYNRWMADNFYQDPGITPINKQLFAFASYNAGPGRVAKLRKEAAESGLDPNVWFNNVELVAAKRIGRETVTYVSNIFKYYLAYQMMMRTSEAREAAKKEAAQ